ncbi:hypothetical protein [uncultured Maricaulis sp.]|uniref:hypothetical protein n=1 Tax=uncultured Maricaulis sp. TaxID=174710 RepID=UPI0030D87BF6
MIVATILLAVSLAASAGESEPSMLLGMQTRDSKTLLSKNGESLYALQLTPLDGRLCQVRAFFRGAPPRTARFCSSRVTGRQVARSGVAVLGLGEMVHGVGACIVDSRIVAVRFYTGAGAYVTAQTGECTGSYQQIWCQGTWVVQGVQLYFGGASWLRPRPSLQGIRPLCSTMVGG